MKNKNIIPHNHIITMEDRILIKNHKSCVVWFTGLSGSGKSTIAGRMEEILNKDYHVHTYLLDGDNIRTGLNKDLGFTSEDRNENIRRIGEVSKLFFDAGLVVITAFISPYQRDRDEVRSLLPSEAFIEIFVDCPLDVCESRDPKGLYKKVREGEIKEFTGISSGYEQPVNPEIRINSHEQSVDECVQIILNFLEIKKVIKKRVNKGGL